MKSAIACCFCPKPLGHISTTGYEAEGVDESRVCGILIKNSPGGIDEDNVF